MSKDHQAERRRQIKEIKEQAFDWSIDYKPCERDLEPSKYGEYGFQKGAEWMLEKIRAAQALPAPHPTLNEKFAAVSREAAFAFLQGASAGCPDCKQADLPENIDGRARHDPEGMDYPCHADKEAWAGVPELFQQQIKETNG